VAEPALTTTAPASRPLYAVVLAAGAGTRMRSSTPKVLHEIGGRTLLAHALEAVRTVGADEVVVVVGHDADQVGEHATGAAPTVRLALQPEQNGTGHAVQLALSALAELAPAGAAGAPGLAGTVVVTMGDVPLLTVETVRALVADHDGAGRAVSVLTAEVADPSGYGRIVRDGAGRLERIVEHKDASPAELAGKEVNAGIYAFDVAWLGGALQQVGAANAQGEIYLTDVIAIARADGLGLDAVALPDVWQCEGVNDRLQLARLGAELNRRTLHRWMRDGVTVVDPASTWVDVSVTLECDVTLAPGVQLHGHTTVAQGALIGPDTTLTDVAVGAGAQVMRTHGSGSVVAAGATVGPFAYLRPGTVLGEGGKIGTFVETKNATIGPGAKVPHLSYVGDATIGASTNIGAGTIFANYDGVDKHTTTVGAHCKTGSDNVFVAPVRIGDGAVTGAGATIRDDVPPGALAVSAGSQRIIEGWVADRWPGSAAAAAAAAESAETTPEEGSS